MNKATQLSSQNNTLNLDIEGMTCAACAARIERVISKQEDVLDVSVSFPLKSAIVDIKNIINQNFDGKYILIFPFCSKKHIKKKWPYFSELITKIKEISELVEINPR